MKISRLFKKTIEYPFRRTMGTITHVETDDPVVALTFDDGPDVVYTPKLLEILAKHQAHATFFMVGCAAARYSDIVRRVSTSGHAIGNHSWDHPSFPLITGKERRAQIRACAKALAPYGQKLLRPPYGNQNIVSRLDAMGLGYVVVTWNVVAEDWLEDNAETIVSRVESKIEKGSIILFHDSLYHSLDAKYGNREMTLKAVEMLLGNMRQKYRFVTVPELFRHGNIYRKLWWQKPDVNLLNRLEGIDGRPRRYSVS